MEDRFIKTICLASFFSLIFLILVKLESAYALTYNPDNSVDKIPFTQCKFQPVLDALIMQSIKHSAKIGDNQVIVLDKLEAILNKLPDNNKPIAEQLPADQLATFNSLSQQSANMLISSLIESRHERDLKVINKLLKAADDYYRFGTLPDPNDPDAIYMVILIKWQEKLQPKVQQPSFNECTLDYALAMLELESLKKLSKLVEPANKGASRINQIYSKYPNIDKTKVTLSPEDKAEITDIEESTLTPANEEKDYIINIENIRHFYRISELIQKETTQGLINSGGNTEKAWDTINEKIKNGELTEEDATMIAFWQVINNLIPSDLIKDFNSISKKTAK